MTDVTEINLFNDACVCVSVLMDEEYKEFKKRAKIQREDEVFYALTANLRSGQLRNLLNSF